VKPGPFAAVYAETVGCKDDHDFTPPRGISASISTAAARRFFSSTTRSASQGDKMAYAKQALEHPNFFGAPHVAIIHTDEPLGIWRGRLRRYALTSCWRRRRSVSARFRRPRWRGIPG
jgi:hypothetical protein